MRKYTPDNINKLLIYQIFVFGSNAKGLHGKGAALIAKERFGAIQGQAEGLQGQSYAIITKKDWRTPKSSTLAEIKDGIEKFLIFAKTNKNYEFLVTKLGSSLAGYTVEEIKSLFEGFVNEIPDNVILPIEYEVRPNIFFEEDKSDGYRNRTIKNASADVTIAFAINFNSAGEKLTKKSVIEQNKKYIAIDANILDVTKDRIDKLLTKNNSINPVLPLQEPMNYDMPISENILGINTNTLDEIIKGIRTSTTRGYFHNVVNKHCSSVLALKDKQLYFVRGDKKCLVKIIDVHKITKEDRQNPEFLEQWEQSECWTRKHLLEKTKIGEYQIKFKVIEKPEITLNIAGNGIYTMKGLVKQTDCDRLVRTMIYGLINHKDFKYTISSIRTGGQSGFDESGTKAALQLEIPTLVLAPKGWKYRNSLGQDIFNENEFKSRFLK